MSDAIHELDALSFFPGMLDVRPPMAQDAQSARIPAV